VNSSQIPAVFLERLTRIVPPPNYSQVVESFNQPKPLVVRVNTLKKSIDDAREYFKSQNYAYEEIPWCREAFILPAEDKENWRDEIWVNDGNLYIQNLSSLIPVVVLDPQPGDRVWDMCAAPGSKTTQIAARMRNEGTIVATERVKERFFKLTAILKRSGVQITDCKLTDARRYRHRGEMFDKILVDAPCSSEGMFQTGNAKSVGYWSLRKIREMATKQRGLLMSASRCLKPGGTLVYSTCTLAPEENEAGIDWLLKKTENRFKLLSLNFIRLPCYPILKTWGKKTYADGLQHAIRILPGDRHIGFFIAKLTLNS
jgi:16S rRNA (cytosine1407-C5)-methyltransferase